MSPGSEFVQFCSLDDFLPRLFVFKSLAEMRFSRRSMAVYTPVRARRKAEPFRLGLLSELNAQGPCRILLHPHSTCLNMPDGFRHRPFSLLQRVREAVRARQYSIRTEEAYASWIRRYILFHHRRHPAEMSEAEVGEFLTHLATQGEVTASTHNQALNALIFLYRHILERPLSDLGNVVRAKRYTPPALRATSVARDEPSVSRTPRNPGLFQRAPHPLRNQQQSLVVVVVADELYAERKSLRTAARRQRDARQAEQRPVAIEERAAGAFEAGRRLIRRARRQ